MCEGKDCQRFASHVVLEIIPDIHIRTCCECFKKFKPECDTMMQICNDIEKDLANPLIQFDENTDIKFPIEWNVARHNRFRMMLLRELLYVFPGKEKC